MGRHTSICLFLFLSFLPGRSEAHQLRATALQEANAYLPSIAQALESYVIDNGRCPAPSSDPPYGLQGITTPIAYIATLPFHDSFRVIDSYPKPPEQLEADMEHDYRIRQLISIFMLVAWPTSLAGLIVAVKRRQKRRYWNLALGVISLVVWLPLSYLALPGPMHRESGLSYIVRHYITRDPSVRITFTMPLGPMDYSRFYGYACSVDGDAFVHSRGPDLSVGEAFVDAGEKNTDAILETVVTYAPTNGLLSSGDIWVMVPKSGETIHGIWRYRPTGRENTSTR